MRVKVTKTEVRDILIRDEPADHEEGTAAGWYAYVGHPRGQSDFVTGPHRSRRAAGVAACDLLRSWGYHVERAR